MARHRAEPVRRHRPRALALGSTAAVVAGVALVAAALPHAAHDRSAGSLPAADRSSVSARAVSERDVRAALKAAPVGARAATSAVALPASVQIPAIGVDSTLVRLGTQADGTLAVPTSYTQAGWFTGGPAPGEVGPAVIAGHLDSKAGPGVFARLSHLVPGDDIVVHRVDGTSATFVVTRLQQVAKASFPTEDVYGPVAGPELRVITCGGAFSTATGHYVDNVLVYAREV